MIAENSLNLVITSFQTTYNSIRSKDTKRFQLFIELKSVNDLYLKKNGKLHIWTVDTLKISESLSAYFSENNDIKHMTDDNWYRLNKLADQSQAFPAVIKF